LISIFTLAAGVWGGGGRLEVPGGTEVTGEAAKREKEISTLNSDTTA